jgi:hypothetical protein
MRSRSDARIDLNVPPNYIGYSTIEDRSDLAVVSFGRLNP